ncbi:hypothetical protein ACLI4U_18995 (plasmid) [Natrialbaceae archaeon A-CW2]
MASNPIQGTIEWIFKLILHAFGRGTPEEGMRASAILFAVTFASNAIGFWFTIVLDILFFFLFLFNLARYVWGEM